MTTVGIIGGGASGLVAAICAARGGAKVTLIERQNRIGKKILVTGNGRCNLTHTKVTKERFHTHSEADYFKPIERINQEDTLTFFKELGIELLIENAKIYPASEQANSILDVMRLELEQLGVEMIVEEKIVALETQSTQLTVKSETGRVWHFDRLIMATGGLAAPKLGCDETGYELLQGLGHKLEPTYPTLVHILSSTPYCKMMKGTRVKGEVAIYVKGKKKRSEYGEVLFTEDGLSGPSIFQLSRIAAKCQMEKQACEIKLDLFREETEDSLVTKLYDRIGRHPYKTIEELFIGWLHKRVAIPVIKQAGIGSPIAPCENLDYEMIVELAKSMKGLVFNVTGTRGYPFAQATAGGINLKDINLETMQSKYDNRLYVVGEVLDVDGDCGGFNLQWAWSTGMLAGQHVASY